MAVQELLSCAVCVARPHAARRSVPNSANPTDPSRTGSEAGASTEKEEMVAGSAHRHSMPQRALDAKPPLFRFRGPRSCSWTVRTNQGLPARPLQRRHRPAAHFPFTAQHLIISSGTSGG